MSTVLVGRRALARSPRRGVVTVGMFDGVHRAHQRLLQTTLALARRLRARSIVITFDPDPQLVLTPPQVPVALMPLAARVALIQRSGVDLIWVIRFTRAFSRTTPTQFVEELLVKRAHAAGVVVGHNFMFGNDRQGTTTLLRTLGRRYRMQVVTVAPVLDHGAAISSSRIRRCLREGEIEQAARLLGRPPMLWGRIVHGTGRGHRLGFPTANVRLRPTVLPQDGVYAVELFCGARRWPGVMNLGSRPTFGPGPRTCEVHCPTFRGALYGRSVRIAIVKRLRDERQFRTPEALVRQIRRDLRTARLR